MINTLVALTVACILFWVLYDRALPAYKRYRIKRTKLREVEDKHANLLKIRKDLMYQFDWAIDSGENKIELVREVRKIDKELEELYQQHKYMKRSPMTVPLKSLYTQK